MRAHAAHTLQGSDVGSAEHTSVAMLTFVKLVDPASRPYLRMPVRLPGKQLKLVLFSHLTLSKLQMRCAPPGVAAIGRRAVGTAWDNLD